MANRALQAKSIKLQKQNAARPYQYDARVIVLRDNEKHIPAQVARPKVERELVEIIITSRGNGPTRTPIFNAVNWDAPDVLIKRERA